MPTMAVTKTSICSITAISRRPSMPWRTFVPVSATFFFNSSAASGAHITAYWGENSRICLSISRTLLPAARAVTCKSSLLRTISSVCVPIEPVEPKIPIFFISSSIHGSPGDCTPGRYAIWHIQPVRYPCHPCISKSAKK